MATTLIPSGGSPIAPLPGNISGDPNFWPLWRTTRYIDKEGSPELNLYPDRGQILRTVYVANDVVDQAIIDFWGLATVKLDIPRNVRYLARDIPHQYPKRPWMYVQNIGNVQPLVSRARNANGTTLADFQGIDTDGTPLYQIAEMQLQYVMPSFFIRTDDEVKNDIIGDTFQGFPDEGQAIKAGYRTKSRYITRFPKMMSKMLTIPRGLVKDSSSKVIAEAIAINEHVAEYIYTWHQVPIEAVPEATWIAGANSVNDSTFDGRPAGTLLFAGEPEVKISPNPITGQLLCDVTYRFHSLLIFDSGDTANPKGFNYIRRATNTGFLPLLFSAVGGASPPENAKIFRSFDFRKFFRPDQ